MKKNDFLLVLLICIGPASFFLAGCGSKNKQDNIYVDPSASGGPVSEKYSIAADRKAIEDLRKNVPPEKKQENDELAFILALTNEVKLPPNKVREEFDKVSRKKRELFNRDLQKERETFNSSEKKKKEEFLKAQDSEKKNFMKQTFTRDQKNEFFKDVDAKRTQYFSDEKERRADYESQTREKRKNFEDYYKEKNDTFNQEYRSYTKRYDEMKKQKREQDKLQAEAAKNGQSVPKVQNGSNHQPEEVPSFAAQVMGVSDGSENNTAVSDGAPNSDMAKLLIELEQELAKSKSRVGTKLESGH